MGVDRQAQSMILLTANRSMKGEESLEEVMREENTPESLPVVTIGNADRILNPTRSTDFDTLSKNFRRSQRIGISDTVCKQSNVQTR